MTRGDAAKGGQTVLTLLASDVIGAQVDRLTDDGLPTEYIPGGAVE